MDQDTRYPTNDKVPAETVIFCGGGTYWAKIGEFVGTECKMQRIVDAYATSTVSTFDPSALKQREARQLWRSAYARIYG